MAITSAQIVATALEAAHSPGKTVQAATILQSILSDLCDTYDFAVARGLYTFNFNPALTSSIASHFGSGPYPLPLDFLRTSGSSGSTGSNKSVWWTLLGVPYPMVPIDLSEFDMQVQQAGLQSYPYLFATDISPEVTYSDRIVQQTLADTATGSTVLGNVGGLGTAQPGMGVAGYGIAPGSVLTGSNPPTLSLAATGTFTQAVISIGVQPNGYVWPPPSGAFPCFVRYQRQMPILAFPGLVPGGPANSLPPYPWFPNSEYLIRRLEGELCVLNDDERWMQLLGDEPHGAQGILKRFLKLKDDDTNRAKQVQLDRRTFGQKFNLLPNTKQVGW